MKIYAIRVYSKDFKLKAIKHAEMNILTVPVVAELKKIPSKTLYRWITNYRMFGENSLENKRPGTKPMRINEKFEVLVLEKWKERKRSSHKLWIDLKMEGYGVSQRQIQKIYQKHGLTMNKRSRPSQIKFVKYE